MSSNGFREDFDRYVAFSWSASQDQELKPSEELLQSFKAVLPKLLNEDPGSTEKIVKLISTPKERSDGLKSFLTELNKIQRPPENTIDTLHAWEKYYIASPSEQCAAICLMLRILPAELNSML